MICGVFYLGSFRTILCELAWEQPDKLIGLFCSEQGLNLVEDVALGLALKAFF